MPKNFLVSLVDRAAFVFTATTFDLSKRFFGLIEPLSRKPLYMDQFYLLYKYSRVISVNYHFEIVNTGSVPFEAMFAICPISDANVITETNLGEKPGVIRHLVSAQGGVDKVVISKTCIAQDWMGQPYFDRNYWVNYAQATSATPLDVDEPVGIIGFAPIIGNPSFQFTTRVTYNLQFFDLEAIPLNTVSTRLGVTQTSPEDSMEEVTTVVLRKKQHLDNNDSETVSILHKKK